MGSAPSSSALKDKTVVVIGASFGGNSVALLLRGKCKLVVIDSRECMHLSISSPRSIVEPDFTKKTLLPLKDMFGDSFKQGTVTKINSSGNSITLASDEEILYDYLVIATGSSSPFPGKIEDDTSVDQTYKLYKNANEKVKSAQKITLIGGGAVGVELAGEIATDFPKKEVTIVHSRDTLVEPALNMKFRNKVKRQLEELNVKLVMGEKVLNVADIPRDMSGGPIEVKTDKGKIISSDLVIVCIGITVNNAAYSDSLSDCMDEQGSLKVSDNFLVEGHRNIFAIGDCCNADTQKMANRAIKHGEFVFENIMLHADGKAMKSYKIPGIKYAVTVGRTRGAIQVGNVVVGSWLVKRLKGRDMFAARLWSDMGLKLPST